MAKKKNSKTTSKKVNKGTKKSSNTKLNTNKKASTNKKTVQVNNKNKVATKKKYKKKAKKKQSFLKKTIKNIKKSFNKLLKSINKCKKKINIKRNNKKEKRLEQIEEEARIEEEQKNLINREKSVKSNHTAIIIRISIIAILLAGMIYFCIMLNKKENKKVETLKNISIKEYTDLYKNDGTKFIYIKKNNCTYCELVEENLTKIQKEYNIEFNTINISKLNEEEMNELNNSIKSFSDEYEEPFIFSINNGEVITSLEGYKEYSVLKRFIEYSNNPSDANSFNKVEINKYLSLLKSKETSIIYICESNSSACKVYNEILEEVSQEKELTINYLNTDNINTEEDWNKLSNSNEIFNNIWFVPVTMIIRNGEIVDYKMEAIDKDTLINFLDRNGV